MKKALTGYQFLSSTELAPLQPLQIWRKSLITTLSILLKCLFILLQNKAHPEPVHVGPAKWACSICGIIRSRPAEIKRHFLTHTGEKPFQCTHCPARFNLKANCKSHIRKYHEPPEVEPQMFMKLANS